MPSQPLDFPAVSFSATFPQQNFRLLELPPELVTLIENSSKAQGGRRLWFKSAPTARASNGNGGGNGVQAAAQQGFLHLCTTEKSWAVKQVSTSNSVYVARTRSESEIEQDADGDTSVLQPEKEMADDDQDENEDGEKTKIESATTTRGGGRGITTISRVKNILELVEVKPDVGDVENRVREIVPLFNSGDDGGDEEMLGRPTSINAIASHEGVTLKDVFEAVPAPTTLIADVVRRSFVFETSESQSREEDEALRRVFVPDSSLLLRAWRSFIQQCAISGVKVDGGAGLNGETLRGLFDGLREDADGDVDGEVLVNVTTAILQRFFNDDDDETLCAEDKHSDKSSLGLTQDLTRLLARQKPLTFGTSVAAVAAEQPEPHPRTLIGTWLLASLSRQSQSHSHSSEAVITLSSFRDQWASLLPDSWAADCDPRALISSHPNIHLSVSDDGEEDGEVLIFAGATATANENGNGNAKGTGRGVLDAKTQQKKRKWHERFGAQRSASAASIAVKK